MAEPARNITGTPYVPSINLYDVVVGHGREHVDGLTSDMRSRLSALISAAPSNIRDDLGIYSGARSSARQAQLYRDAVKKYGSAAAARRWVAPPGNSMHEKGKAVDLSYKGESLKGAPASVVKWLHDNAPKYGIYFPLGNENWHAEAIGTRPGSIAGKKAIEQLQKSLVAGGADIKIDGKWGPATAEAFYKATGLGDGSATSDTMTRAEAQQAIADLGFTGASAVLQFQRAAGIPADGKIGPVTRDAIRDAMAQDTRFADRALVPPADIPTVPALTPDGARAIYQDQNSAAQPVSASDLVRQYGGLQGNPVPTIPVERAPVADLTPRAADIVAAAGGAQYDPLSSVATPAAGDVVRSVAPEAARYDPLSSVATPSSIVAAAGQRGIGSDPDRNYGDPSSPDFGRDIEATNYARQSLADYASLRNGYPAENGTNAALPPARGLETMGANSPFDDPGVESYTPQPRFSSRMSGYDPLSSIITPASIIAASARQAAPAPAGTISEADFNDRWGAATAPYSPMSGQQFDDRWNAALATPASSPSASQTISNAAFNDRWGGTTDSGQVASSRAQPSAMVSTPALGVIKAATAAAATSPSAFDSRYASGTSSPSSFDNSYSEALGPVVAPSRTVAPAVDQTRTASIPAQSYDPLSSVRAPTATTTDVIDAYTPASETSASAIIKAAAAGNTAASQKQTSFPGKEKDDFVGTPQADVVMTQKADGTRVYGDTTPKPLAISNMPTPRERPLQKEYSQPGPLKKGGGFANTGIKNKTAMGVIGAALGAMAGSPVLGATVGKALGKAIDRYSPVYDQPALQGLNYIGSGLGAVQKIINGSAPANSVASAANVPAGYRVRWSNSGPGGSAQQHVSTPSGGGYTVTSIGPSLSPIVATTYDSSSEKRRDSTSGGSGNASKGNPTGTGGLY